MIYIIQEDQNGTFAKIKAASPASALRKAARAYPRHACDYSLEPGETCEVTWRAYGETDSEDTALACVKVPGGPDDIEIGTHA